MGFACIAKPIAITNLNNTKWIVFEIRMQLISSEEVNKIKLKFSPCMPQKPTLSGGIVPLFHDLCSRCRRVVSFSNQPLYLAVKEPPTPGTQGWVGTKQVWTLWRRNKDLAPQKNRTTSEAIHFNIIKFIQASKVCLYEVYRLNAANGETFRKVSPQDLWRKGSLSLTLVPNILMKSYLT